MFERYSRDNGGANPQSISIFISGSAENGALVQILAEAYPNIVFYVGSSDEEFLNSLINSSNLYFGEVPGTPDQAQEHSSEACWMTTDGL